MKECSEAKMDKSKSRFICLVVTSYCATVLTGCSLIGYAIGASTDHGQPGAKILISDGLDALALDTKVIVVKRNGTTVEGDFKGVSPAPRTVAYVNYGEEFERWRTLPGNESNRLPSFGSRVQILVTTQRSTISVVGQFAGFDRGQIRLITSEYGKPVEYNVASVREVHHTRGDVITADNLEHAFAEGVPLARGQVQYEPTAVLQLEVLSAPGFKQVERIALADVQSVRLCENTNARWAGLGIGAIIDVIVVIAAIDAFNHMSFGFSNTH
jgi:hypothetical protein